MEMLTNRIEKVMAKLQVTPKEFASQVHDACNEDLKWSTIESKASKLRSGDPEGREFFQRNQQRIDALATVLEITADECRTWLQQDAEHVVLVVDSDVEEDAVAHIRARFALGAGNVSLVIPEHGSKEALREVALARQRAHHVVVVTNSAEVSVFLEGAGLTVVEVDRHGKRWVLSDQDDLIPVIPPPKPVRVSDDGVPMLPSDDVERDVLRSHKPERTRVREIRDLGGQPTFPLPRVLSKERVAGAFNGSYLDSWFDESTPRCWNHDGQIYTVGSLPGSLLQRLHAMGHKTNKLDLSRLRQAISTANPWDYRSKIIADAAVELFEATGLELDHERAKKKAIDEFFERLTRPSPDSGKERWRLSLDSDIDIRRFVRAELCAREFHGGDLSNIAPWAVLCQRLLTAPVTNVATVERAHIHFVADLGAGRLVAVQAVPFPAEERLPFTGVRQYHQDRPALTGGDLVLRVTDFYSRRLESSIERPRENRRDADD